ncbi:hypothetical protein EWM64_g8918 [Hericium alpestre]|uniref:Uncharacterized protein n=1 Tax=Hericium alpestre TaxID=135208 RepID=A0A4Y9ZKH7_9AGAM|nr:hypothetical protein EWM64_g8918 [Hericium alpestre]
MFCDLDVIMAVFGQGTSAILIYDVIEVHLALLHMPVGRHFINGFIGALHLKTLLPPFPTAL